MKTAEQRKLDYERTKAWREQNREKAKEHSQIARQKKAEEFKKQKNTIDYLKGLLSKHGIFYKDEIC